MNCPHFMSFASWYWALGDTIENASLYLRPNESVFACDLRAELNRWDRMYDRDHRRTKRNQLKEVRSAQESVSVRINPYAYWRTTLGYGPNFVSVDGYF